MARLRFLSTRSMLRAYQTVRRGADDEGYREDLAFLQAKDLDLSIRLGALLAFDALLTTAAINPIASSPGAPLSLDAAKQAWEVGVICLGVLLLSVSAILCVRAIAVGEEFSAEGIEDDPKAIMHRMFATYCTSVDFQARMLRIASWFSIAGGIISVLACGWIMLAKLQG
jgi:hypothetical protein